MSQAPVRQNDKDSVLFLNKLGQYLVAQGVGTLGTDIFLQALPEDPDTGTVVVHTGGISLPEDPTRRPGFQVLHRNVAAEAGLSKSVEINRLFDDQWNVLDGFPGRITAVSEPGPYFKDEAGRFNYSMNFVFVSTFQR